LTDYQLVVIGAGLSGLAAGIRAARFGLSTLIVEKHHRIGGLNSWYRRQGTLFETGLHAMTNYAPASEKRAPLNRLFRQLKLSRKRFLTREQFFSEIVFPWGNLRFSNDATLLADEVRRLFPERADRFVRLLAEAEAFDPFAPAPWRSAREYLHRLLACPELENMLLLPIMVYGNAEEHDMDLAQFMIMFRALFLEGFFRPGQTIREFLALLEEQFRAFGGTLRLNSGVEEILRGGGRVRGVRLEGGEEIRAGAVLSTVGVPGTARLVGWTLDPERWTGRMSFTESIALLPTARCRELARGRTIVFFSLAEEWDYRCPQDLIDPGWGVICFPAQFRGVQAGDLAQIRITNPASYECWKRLDPSDYVRAKEECRQRSREASRKIVGNYEPDIVYQDSFTPLTIERFTGKAAGAVYGSPVKIRDGRTPWENLFIAGTDQGFLGIVGAMLSGVTMVNQHLLR